MKKLLLLLVACRSDASHYYTLSAPGAAASASAELQIDVLPVSVPADVDRSQIVLTTGAGEVTPTDSHTWIAPLANEVQHALSEDLSRALGAHDVEGLTAAANLPTWRIKLVVRRFESVLHEHATIEAMWTVRTSDGAPLTCASQATEPAAGDFAAIAVAHQKALAKIAAEIATAVRASATTCPRSN
jgi:hypothetical protein